MIGRDGGGWVGSERDEKLRCGRSEEVERGKSSVRSTIFPSRRAVTFYLASFGECSDWSVEKEISFFLRGEGNARSFALLVQRSLAAATDWIHLHPVAVTRRNGKIEQYHHCSSNVLRLS